MVAHEGKETHHMYTLRNVATGSIFADGFKNAEEAIGYARATVTIRNADYKAVAVVNSHHELVAIAHYHDIVYFD